MTKEDYTKKLKKAEVAVVLANSNKQILINQMASDGFYVNELGKVEKNEEIIVVSHYRGIMSRYVGELGAMYSYQDFVYEITKEELVFLKGFYDQLKKLGDDFDHSEYCKTARHNEITDCFMTMAWDLIDTNEYEESCDFVCEFKDEDDMLNNGGEFFGTSLTNVDCCREGDQMESGISIMLASRKFLEDHEQVDVHNELE